MIVFIFNNVLLYKLCFVLFISALLVQECKTEYSQTLWQSSNISEIKLLGIFADDLNISQSSTLTTHSRAMFQAALLLSHEYNITIDGHLIGWHIVGTDGDFIKALRGTCLATSRANIAGIVGPAFSREALVIAPFTEKTGTPMISYGATDPDLTDKTAYPTFHRTIPSDSTAALSIAEFFVKFNWTSCIIVHQNDAFGTGGVKAITEAFNDNNLTVSQTIAFDMVSHTIQGSLRDLLVSSSTRIVILWAEPTHTTSIIQFALDSKVLGPLFTWITSSRISLDSFNESSYDSLVGIITIEPTVGGVSSPFINTTLLTSAYRIWKQNEPESYPDSSDVSIYALFAFDATWTLIQSLQKLCSNVVGNSSCIPSLNSSFCFDNRFLNSKALLDTITRIEFIGVSGPIQFSMNETQRINGTYYLAKNVQITSQGLEYVSVLEWFDLGDWKPLTKWDSIVWPGSSLLPPKGCARLKDVNLRIGIIQSIPFTMVTNVIDSNGQSTVKFVGYIPDLINLLQEQMQFIPTLILAPSNRTYAGLIDDVANGVYDIVVGDVTITAARREKVGFSSAIFDSATRIIMRAKGPVTVNIFAYCGPFSFNLWIVLLATTIFAALCIYLLERTENQTLRNRSFISSISMSWWYAVGTIMGHGANFHVATAAGRLLTIGLCLLSLVLRATYTANLASDLTVAKSENIITGIDDIKNGKIPFNRIGIRVGTVGEEYYLREISGGNRNYYPLTSRQQMYDSLLRGLIDASFMDSGSGQYITNNIYCNLTLVGEEFDQSAFGIVISKHWQYGEDLDVNILSLRESGILDSLKRKWFQSNICPVASSKPSSLVLKAMGGLFITFGIISILSILLFIWQRRPEIRRFLRKIRTQHFRLFQHRTRDGHQSKENIQPSCNIHLEPSIPVCF